MSLLWLIITLIYIDLLFEEWWMGRDMRVFLFLFFILFMLHVPLHITKVIMLAESRFGWALFAGTQNNHNPIMGYFGHGSGRLLN